MPSILIVDDEYGLAEMTAELLTMAGYTVATALNGRLALAMLHVSRPDLILLDLMMPIMSGDEMLRELDRSPELRDIPVIMMSAVDREALPGELQSRVTGFLRKPFTYDELMAALHVLEQPSA